MTNRRPSSLFLVLALYLGLLAGAVRVGGVVGDGSPTGRTDAALAAARTDGGVQGGSGTLAIENASFAVHQADPGGGIVP
jgi:hypothetical protein